jgi:hypothetical protein
MTDTSDRYGNALHPDPERDNDVMSFSAYLTQTMVQAVGADDNVLDWRVVVYAAATAIRTVGAIAQVIASNKGEPITDAQLQVALSSLIAKALSIEIMITEVGGVQEADAMMDAMANPKRRH